MTTQYWRDMARVYRADAMYVGGALCSAEGRSLAGMQVMQAGMCETITTERENAARNLSLEKRKARSWPSE